MRSEWILRVTIHINVIMVYVYACLALSVYTQRCNTNYIFTLLRVYKIQYSPVFHMYKYTQYIPFKKIKVSDEDIVSI